MRKFDTGATRDTAENKLHYAAYLSPQALERFAQYMKGHEVQADGQRRAPDNWKKGIPMDAYEDSMMRHVMEFRRAVEEGRLMDAEETMCAVMFNVQGWLHERVKSRVWGTASDVTFPIPGDMKAGAMDPYYEHVSAADVAGPQPDMDRATQPENALAEPRITKREYPASMETTKNDIIGALDKMFEQEFAPAFFEDTPFKREPREPREIWEARQQRPQPGLDPSKDRL